MSQSLSQVYLHLVFSTKDRYPFLKNENVRNELYSYLAKTLQDRQCFPKIIGGTEDHVHLLFNLCSTDPFSKIIGDLKRYTSKWIKTKDVVYQKFSWQRGYGVFSVSQSELARVQAYIQNQASHHKRMNYKDEFLELIKRHRINFDEKYLWD